MSSKVRVGIATQGKSVVAFLALAITGLAVAPTWALVKIDDNWFTSESKSATIVWTSTDLENIPTDLKFLYKHWGDGGAEPAKYTDALGGEGKKPRWPEEWNGTTIGPKSASTTHAKGSVSTSDWTMTFVTRTILGTNYPGINGSMTAIADKANLTWSSTDAHTITEWSDPWLFTIPPNTAATIGVQHAFVSGGTSAIWQKDFPSDTGGGLIMRWFQGDLTDATGAWLDPTGLELVSVGTESFMNFLILGSDVTLDDGSTVPMKMAELQAGLNGNNWNVPFGTPIVLDFTWHIAPAGYSRSASLDMGGVLRADEAQDPIPEPSTWLLATLALTALWGQSRIR